MQSEHSGSQTFLRGANRRVRVDFELPVPVPFRVRVRVRKSQLCLICLQVWPQDYRVRAVQVRRDHVSLADYSFVNIIQCITSENQVASNPNSDHLRKKLLSPERTDPRFCQITQLE